MKALVKYFCFLGIVSILTTSCEKSELAENQNPDNFSIKSEVTNGRTVTVYLYNNIVKISESEGLFFYSRYLYDNDDKLVKVESAMDPSLLSSAIQIEKTELMTAKNCTITNYQIFKYDQDKRLIECENYFKKSGEFVMTSKYRFEYDKNLIAKRKLYNENGDIAHSYTYEYDNNGNVKTEKYYSYLSTGSAEPKLISETSYKYDTKKNPFVIFKDLGNPGFYTNTNNIIETNSTLYENVPGIDKYSTSKTSYKYNSEGYPVKIITTGSEFEYKY